MFVGTYRKVGTKTNPPSSLRNGKPYNVAARVGTKSYASVTQPQIQQPQQQQQHPPSQSQPSNNQEIQILKQTVTELKEMLQQQVSENKALMQQMMQQQAQMCNMMQMIMATFTARQGNGIDITPYTTQPTQSHVPASPAMTATSRNMPPPSPKVRTPGPRPKQVDLSSQTLITEAIRGNTPQPTPTRPHTQMSEAEKAHEHITQAHKPTPGSARNLTGNTQTKPPTPARPNVGGKRPRITSSPQ